MVVGRALYACACTSLMRWRPAAGGLQGASLRDSHCLSGAAAANPTGADDAAAFFQRCIAKLKPGGLIFVKENVCQEGFVVDNDDASLTRWDGLASLLPWVS